MLTLKPLKQSFSICQVRDYSQVNWDSPYIFLSKTDQENSLVCPSQDVPDNAIEVDNGWSAFRIEGVLDFSLIGILSKLSAILADNEIGIFAVSTYNTDYILTKTTDFDRAMKVLEEKGYKIEKI